MKRHFKLMLLALAFLPIVVQASGSASLSTSANSVEVGSKVTATVTLKNTAAWNIKINSSGATRGCSQSFADATSNGQNTTKTLSVTCKSTEIGAIAFTVTGDITSADGANSNVSASKRVTVTAVRPKSTDATLSSLGVEGYELTPAFSKDTLEYNVTVPSTVDKVVLVAKANEAHASVEGTGEFEVTEGLNTFQVNVTAENGSKKTYTVHINVEDTNPIRVEVDDKEYTLVKNAKNLTKPELYEETTVKINDMDIPAFYSDITKFTLIGLKNENGEISLAIYDEKNNSYTIYNEFVGNNLSLYIVNFDKPLDGYIKDVITIAEKEVEVYRYQENSRFVIVYAMNLSTGEYNYYSYDTEENTFQIYNDEEIKLLKKESQNYLYICMAFGGGLLLAFILIIYLLVSKKKKKRKMASLKNKEEVNRNKVKNEKNTHK